MRQRWGAAAVLVCLLAAAVTAWPQPAGDGEPRFNAHNELLRPEGYREWIFVGASLGMSYGENPVRRSTFHNVYLHPRSYQEYKKSGQFPERTILAMEVLTPDSQSSINRQGSFEDRPVALEAAVKDSGRFPEGWAYFDFRGGGKAPFPGTATAKAFPKEVCWSCHKEHAGTDNVFTQFYPVLRRDPPAFGAGR